MEDLEVCLKISSTLTFAMMYKVLMVMVEVYIGLSIDGNYRVITHFSPW